MGIDVKGAEKNVIPGTIFFFVSTHDKVALFTVSVLVVATGNGA